ncbi:hypothetical protein DL93DRAFT_2111451 [Clavulina sp. PMI_390]|nr:hypothetical protein DL93DRAFT_2111451 [Clavulina sp. PMI_390]
MATPEEIQATIGFLQRRLASGSAIDIGDGQSGPSAGFIQARMYALEKEERLVQSVSESIRNEKELWALAKLRTQNALIPISRLPDELLSEIFLILSRLDPSAMTLDIPSIMSVCHRWRRVALKRGSLWSNITVKGSRTSIELAQTYLLRSIASPISLSLHLTGDDMRRDPYIIRDILEQIFIPHVSRCIEVDIDIPIYGVVEFFPLPAPSPDLHSIRLAFQGQGSVTILPPLFQFSEAVDITIKSLVLAYDIPLSMSNLFRDLSLEALNSLELCGTFEPSVLHLLERTPNLARFKWAGNNSRGQNVALDSVVRLAHLQEAFMGPTGAALLGQRLDAPELQRLIFTLPDCRTTSQNVLPGLFSGSARYPELTHVSFSSVHHITSNQLHGFLVMHENLEVIRLMGVMNDRPGIDLLAQLEASRRPHPKLRHILLGFPPPNISLPRAVPWGPPVPPDTTSATSFSRIGYIVGRILGRARTTSADHQAMRVTIYASEAQRRELGDTITSNPMVQLLDYGRDVEQIEPW